MSARSNGDFRLKKNEIKIRIHTIMWRLWIMLDRHLLICTFLYLLQLMTTALLLLTINTFFFLSNDDEIHLQRRELTDGARFTDAALSSIHL